MRENSVKNRRMQGYIITKKREKHLTSLLGWIVGLEPTTFRTTI